MQDESAFASSYGPVEGKFGVYVGMMDESPSGYQRPRDLLTSKPIYNSAEEAKGEAERILAGIKEWGKNGGTIEIAEDAGAGIPKIG
jgi:hypothetical protein